MAFEELRTREGAYFLPVVNRMPVALVEGRGSRVVDVDGREYIDLTAGWGVNCLGHCHPTLVEAIRDQAGRLMQTTNLFYTLPQLDLAESLAALTPDAITRSFMVSSGAEAMEGAIKLAHRATGRTRFVSTENSFHGRTLGALQVIGQARHREAYDALLRPQTVVPFDDLAAAEAAVTGETAAFIVEPVQGEGGVNVPGEGYLARLREICHARGALLVLDEIQTGIGRTGKMFALEHEGVVPDILTLGKGLGGGFPLAAFLCTEDVAKTVKAGDHGGTYTGNPLAAAAGNAVLEVVEREGLVARSAELGSRVGTRLAEFASEHPAACEGARGRGLLQALVLRDAEFAGSLPMRALERGILVNVTAGRVMRLFPALNVPEDDLWPALDVLFELIAAGT
jgi:acetylornithine/N-succinyldiaminopimelate aminotransferase